ncbi:N-acetyl-anhydromuranmyl-L-alanine amidase [Vibrio sp. MACH09]|uniref:1,6-anhydro-N-acetylmuramyl-L-alanine amidase AmpD n=1 Tax=Vibrio sp. MACH09 TaxID=3025122 RepID=UPI00278FA1A7|nr:1,6-anhydro-N-acetylmuramyl-L-alanine amidase AmpD [Vibrio sp. MACH09]GLO61827.1 N-acetyl-anhydromuranmyl-L-alanine amidase [Vibrio sp. MACH09]
MIIDNDGWLQKVKKVSSEHFDYRPDNADISLLVIHNISLPPGEYGNDSIEHFFTGQLNPDAHPFFKVIHTMRVSAHCLIKRTGEIIQFVSFYDRAWHAGQSSYAGVERCNDYSIGIELEGTDFDAYTDEQYLSLSQLTLLLQNRFPMITSQRITGHQYIAPLRKTDPGLVFDWRHYRQLINGSDL